MQARKHLPRIRNFFNFQISSGVKFQHDIVESHFNLSFVCDSDGWSFSGEIFEENSELTGVPKYFLNFEL